MLSNVFKPSITTSVLSCCLLISACSPEDMNQSLYEEPSSQQTIANSNDTDNSNTDNSQIESASNGQPISTQSEDEESATGLPLCSEAHLSKALLDEINAARAESRYCGDTYFPSADALSWNTSLTEASSAHTLDMTSNNFFSHTGSDGLNMVSRVNQTGYDWRLLGENIAAGQTSVAQVVREWLASPGHCRNIMKADYKEMGAACMINSDTRYNIYWAQVFGTSK